MVSVCFLACYDKSAHLDLGVTHPSFQAACLALGLLQDDGEWRQCLSDAVHMASASQMRTLFVTILRDCHPTQPERLWEEFKADLCDDLRIILGHHGMPNPTEEQIYDYGLFLLQTALAQSTTSNSLAQMHPSMPHSHLNWGVVHGNELIAEQMAYDSAAQQHEADHRTSKFNADQQSAYVQIMAAVEHQSDEKLFFLNGPGGTGKTFVYNTLCYSLRAKHKIVLCVASSGIAALLLNGGRTAHSRFKIPIPTDDRSNCKISKDSSLAGLLRATDVIIWDEVPMQHRYIPEAVDRTLRDLRNSSEVFGGIPVIFGGDFQQTLPVIPHGTRGDAVDACLQHSPLWEKVKVLFLHENMRLGQQAEEREFAQWLQEIGHGKHTAADGSTKLADTFRCNQNTVESLIDVTYPGLVQPLANPATYFLERAILSARNDDVDEMNTRILDKFPGHERVFRSIDSVPKDPSTAEAEDYPVEFLNSINASGLPLAKLKVKLDCPIMVLRNIDPANGVCNGTRAILRAATNRVMKVEIIGGDHSGKFAFLPRMRITPSNTDLPFELERFQFPVRLAFSMTINKSQGQSLMRVGLDLRTPCFAHGQFYVAMSRVTSVHRIKVLFPITAEEPITTNVVYPEVILDHRSEYHPKII